MPILGLLSTESDTLQGMEGPELAKRQEGRTEGVRVVRAGVGCGDPSQRLPGSLETAPESHFEVTPPIGGQLSEKSYR